MRTLTVGFLTPFYFLRAGMLVSVGAVVGAPFSCSRSSPEGRRQDLRPLPVVGRFRSEPNERWYYTLMMSTGLTFGTISALYGLSHGIITQQPVLLPRGRGHRHGCDPHLGRQPGVRATTPAAGDSAEAEVAAAKAEAEVNAGVRPRLPDAETPSSSRPRSSPRPAELDLQPKKRKRSRTKVDRLRRPAATAV